MIGVMQSVDLHESGVNQAIDYWIVSRLDYRCGHGLLDEIESANETGCYLEQRRRIQSLCLQDRPNNNRRHPCRKLPIHMWT